LPDYSCIFRWVTTPGGLQSPRYMGVSAYQLSRLSLASQNAVHLQGFFTAIGVITTSEIVLCVYVAVDPVVKVIQMWIRSRTQQGGIQRHVVQPRRFSVWCWFFYCLLS